MPEEVKKTEEIKKKLEETLISKNSKVFEDFKSFIGDIFSLEVKLIDTASGQEIAFWKQTIDGDMTIALPINAEIKSEIMNMFSEIVKEAIQKREKFVNFIAQILNIGITLF